MRVATQQETAGLGERPRVMVLDAEPAEGKQVLGALSQAGCDCRLFNESDAALDAVVSLGADVLLVDLGLPRVRAGDILRRLRAESPETAVVLLVSNPVASMAIAAIGEGAFDYLVKPVNPDELAAVVAAALERIALKRENRVLREQLDVATMAAAFVAESPESRRLAELIRRAAPVHSPVLIEGESGTGKELVARMLHHWSGRARGPFVRVSFRSFSAGAGTDFPRHNLQVGAMALLTEYSGRAAGGTLFLDEVNEASAECQAALVTLFSRQRTQPRPPGPRDCGDARVVAASNRALAAEVAANRFRPDLYFTLNLIALHVAPLRGRPADILPLARHFLALHAAESGRPLALTADAERALFRYPWPGNVRELENMIERAVVMSSGERVSAEALGLGPEAEPAGGFAPRASAQVSATAVPAATAPPGEAASETISQPSAHLQPSTHEPRPAPEMPRTPPEAPIEGTLQEWLDRAAMTRIKVALEAARGDRNTVAASLGIDRTTLNRLIKRLGL